MSWITVLFLTFMTVLTFLFGFLTGNYYNILNHEVCEGRIANSAMRGSSLSAQTLEPNPIKKRAVSSSNSSVLRPSSRLRLWLELSPVYQKLMNNIAQPRALTEVFHMFHHPSSPLTSEIVIHSSNYGGRSDREHDLYDGCETVYLTRTGSLANMPNKCLSVGFGAPRDVDPIPHSHRRGKISGMINMYQADYIKSGALRTEKLLLPLLVEHIDSTVQEFLKITGPSIRSDGRPKSIMVMVLNEGVLDVFLNFVCSCKAAGITDIFDNLVVILGQENLLDVIRKMGVKAFYSPYLGPIPKKAAEFYGDLTFGILMWFKVTSVYLAFRAGFNVLFQDVDLVWMENPLRLLEKMEQFDIIFMDDGARTPRFTPFYFNSGFYFVRQTKKSAYLMERMMKTISEIAETHSHQSTLTKYFSEVIDFTDIHFHLLENKDYPSGYQFHHEKEYIQQLVDYKVLPKVFHMCWTESRNDKVKFLKQLGLWFLPQSDNQTCYTYPSLQHIGDSADHHSQILSLSTSAIIQQCCKIGEYWEKRKQAHSE